MNRIPTPPSAHDADGLETRLHSLTVTADRAVAGVSSAPHLSELRRTRERRRRRRLIVLGLGAAVLAVLALVAAAPRLASGFPGMNIPGFPYTHRFRPA